MKIVNILKDLITVIDKEQANNVKYCVDEKNVYITADSHVGYIIPIEKFPISTQNFVHVENLKKLLNIELSEDCKILKTGTLKEFDNNTKILVEFADLNGDNHYVNQKLLKYFDTGATFKTKEYLQPVIIYENERAVGFVMPTRYSDK